MASESYSWQVNKTLAECNRFMYEKQVACDVTFLVGSDDVRITISAHKYVLASRSPVFFAMLLGDIAHPGQGVISVPDILPEAFHLMLRYLYCDECELTSELVLPTLYASKKYIIPALTDKCTAFLELSLNAHNVCLIYEQCLLYDETALLEKCRSYIETQTEEILNSPTFPDHPIGYLEHILKFHLLAVGELQLFRACLEWSKEECRRRELEVTPENQRLVLGGLLFLIHFPTLTIKEFANEVSCTGVLTVEDRCAIFEYLACDEEKRTSAASLRFPTSPRQKPEMIVLKRFETFTRSNVYSGDCSMMKLQCNSPAIIKGFGVSGSMNFDPLSDLQVTIKQDRNFLCNKSIPIVDDLSGNIMQILLPDSVFIQPSLWYTVIITFHFYGDHDQGSCRRGRGGSKTKTIGNVTFDFDRPDSGSLIAEVLFSVAGSRA